jgi:uncharacterized protein
MTEPDPSQSQPAAVPRPPLTGGSHAPDLQPPVAFLPVAAGATDHRHKLELEFRDVQRVCVFYAAMLVPVIAVLGWSFHSHNDSIALEFRGGAALYTVILAFSIAWRREWLHLMRVPGEWSRRLFVITVCTPLCSIMVAHFFAAWIETLGLPVRGVTRGFGDENGYPVWLLFVWAAVLPPVFEEIAFRGLLLAKLERLMGPAQAIWVSALLFGILHLSVLSLAVFLVPLAAVAGYVTRRTGSLLPAIVIHALHNAGVVCLELIER